MHHCAVCRARRSLCWERRWRHGRGNGCGRRRGWGRGQARSRFRRRLRPTDKGGAFRREHRTILEQIVGAGLLSDGIAEALRLPQLLNFFGRRLGRVVADGDSQIGLDDTGFEWRGIGRKGAEHRAPGQSSDKQQRRQVARDHAASARSAKSAHSISRASSPIRPTSWMPTGNPLAPLPAGIVTAGVPSSVHMRWKMGLPV